MTIDVDGSAVSDCYDAEISVIDQYLFEVRNAISYSVSVGVLQSAVSLNKRRLVLQRIRDLLSSQSECVSA